jgi:hypothetical protein
VAARKKKKGRARRRPTRGGGFMQRVLVGLAGVALVLCAASITQGFFFRSGTGGGEEEFRVEVKNGTGKDGLAHAVKRGLHRRGIDVIDVGNADHFDYEQTILIARKPGADVDKLGAILGCKNIVSQFRDGSLADATLILGADYRELNLDWRLESDLLE